MQSDVITNVNVRQLSEQGERIYHEKLKRLLEPKYKGKVIAIEVESGNYFIGESVVEALTKARKVYPDKLFHFMRIGFRALHKRR